MSRMIPFRRGRFEDLPEKPRRAHVYAETRAESVRVDSPGIGPMRAHVRVHGSGPPLLVVHGLMTSSYSWRYAFETLGRAYTVYAPDLPGAGRSEAPPGARYHPDTLARWIANLQRALGIRGCRVIGNSMGGYMCMRLALEDPEAMSCLVNVHSPGIPEARLVALGAALALPGARAVLTRIVQRDPLRWAHANVHYWDESLKSLEEAREYGGPLATEAGAHAFFAYLRETMAIGPVRDLHRALEARRARGEAFPVPMLLVYARRDPMVPPRFGHRFAELTGAPIVWLDEASHFAHVDALERFAPPVLEFLRTR